MAMTTTQSHRFLPRDLRGGVFEARVFEAEVFEARVFEAGVFEARVFEAGVFGAEVFEAGVLGAEVIAPRRSLRRGLVLICGLDVCGFAIGGFPFQTVFCPAESVQLYRRAMLCRLFEIIL